MHMYYSVFLSKRVVGINIIGQNIFAFEGEGSCPMTGEWVIFLRERSVHFPTIFPYEISKISQGKPSVRIASLLKIYSPY